MRFDTQAGGEPEVFASGMKRDHQTAKVRYDLAFDGPMFERYAELLTRGAARYEPRNWMLANGQEELERARASAVRHFVQWYRGDVDEDHAAAIWFNVNLAEYVKDRIERGTGR